MTDRETLIEGQLFDRFAAAPTLAVNAEDGRELLAIHSDGSVTGDVEDASEAGMRFVAYLREHLAVFEKAHTPTDDEREARRVVQEVLDEPMTQGIPSSVKAAQIVMALRRSEVPEPQGDPSDGQPSVEVLGLGDETGDVSAAHATPAGGLSRQQSEVVGAQGATLPVVGHASDRTSTQTGQEEK